MLSPDKTAQGRTENFFGMDDGIKIVHVKDFFCGGVVRFTNHHYFLTIHNKSVVL